jgi:hypothetical protein
MIRKLWIFVVVIAFSAACEIEDVDKSENEGFELIELVETNEVVRKLLAMGFKHEAIQDISSHYLVEGDILFSKDIEDYKVPKNAQYRTNYLVDDQYVVIKVGVDPSIPFSGVDDWRSEIYQALQDWSNIIDCKIFFVSYNDNPDILIRASNVTDNLPNNVIAAAGFPFLNGKPYSEIIINLNFSNNKTVSTGSKRYNMVHELGHCIGFRHTNWQIRGESSGSVGAVWVPGTPTGSDASSVMNAGTANNTWNGFSPYDMSAVKYLYPEDNCSLGLAGPAEGDCAYKVPDEEETRKTYSVFVIGGSSPAGTGFWSVTGSEIEIVSYTTSSCKIRVKSNITNWPATGTVNYIKGSCVTPYSVVLDNCIDNSYTD